MSSQEESEQAVSAYRTAARLLPGDHRPMMYMAKELARTNFLSPALHLLLGAIDISPDDIFLLNELGVIHLKQGKIEESVNYFEKAIHTIESRSVDKTSSSDNRHDDISLRSCNLEVCMHLKHLQMRLLRQLSHLINLIAAAVADLFELRDSSEEKRPFRRCSVLV